MKNLQVFKNEQFGEVRVMEHNGEPWFVGKDIAEILGYERSTKAVADHVDPEDRDAVPIQDSIGRMQNTPIINESGLYSLILSSKLSAAKKFKRWVTAEVLPSIRKHGFYETPRAEVQNERLASVNNAVKILTPLLQAAGCNSEIQLLMVKAWCHENGYPREIQYVQSDGQIKFYHVNFKNVEVA